MNKKFVSVISLLAVVLSGFSFPENAKAAENITIQSAVIISNNLVQVTFDDPGSNLFFIGPHLWHIDVGGGGGTPITPIGAEFVSDNPAVINLQFQSIPFTNTGKSYSAAEGLYADAGAIQDDQGDTNVVITHDNSIAITDGQAPTFTARHHETVITAVDFSEPVQGTLNLADWTIDGETAVSAVANISGAEDGEAMANDETISFVHTNLTLPTNATEDVVYISGDLQDAAGNQLADAYTDEAIDTILPTVLSVSPTDSATGVSRSADVVITFSEGMTPGDLAFSTDPVKDYTAAWSTTTHANDTVTLSHSSFSGSNLYTATIAVGTTDAAVTPNNILEEYEWSFTTKSSGSSYAVTSTMCPDGTSVTEPDVCDDSDEDDADDADDEDDADEDKNEKKETATLKITINSATPLMFVPDLGCQAGYAFSVTTGKPCVDDPALTADADAKTYAFGTTLVKLGTKGEACKAWQTFLNDKANAGLMTDGWCGKLTIAAAKSWQVSVGLMADGQLGSLSRAKALDQ